MLTYQLINLSKVRYRHVCSTSLPKTQTTSKRLHKAFSANFSKKEDRLENERIYYKSSNNQHQSFIHDIPLSPDIKHLEEGGSSNLLLNMVIEIPRNRIAKREASLELECNPIVQDTKKYDGVERLRFLKFFPLFNYGFLPQTWEDPDKTSTHGDFKGDGDPVDVIELSPSIPKVGEILEVQVLGSMGLIDEGEMDWKVIVVDQEYHQKVSKKINLKRRKQLS